MNIPPGRATPLPDDACPIQVRANLFSLGGAVVFGMCVVLTGISFLAVVSTQANHAQRLVALVLMLLGWVYAVNSVSERFLFEGRTIVFTSFFGRTRRIQLDDLEEILLVHEGLNLEPGIERLEIRHVRRPPERFALGPCWQRRNLEAFLHSLEQRLAAPKIFQDVR